MAIVSLEELKAQLRLSVDDNPNELLLAHKIDAAQAHVESLLGFKIDERYPPAGSPAVSTVPAALKECILQLASWWYENRESALVGVSGQELPLGTWDIVNAFRDYSFGEVTTDG